MVDERAEISMQVHMRHSRATFERGGRGGRSRRVSRFEVATVMTLMGVLGTIILFSLSSAAAGGERAACASDVVTIASAASAYNVEHPLVSQLTIGELTAKGTGTLAAWPKLTSGAFGIVIAGDRNQLVGTVDAQGVTIVRNDIIVQVAGRRYDATRSFAAACALA